MPPSSRGLTMPNPPDRSKEPDSKEPNTNRRQNEAIQPGSVQRSPIDKRAMFHLGRSSSHRGIRHSLPRDSQRGRLRIRDLARN